MSFISEKRREQIRLSSKKYRENNPEKRKASSLRYSRENKEKISEYSRKRYSENRLQIKSIQNVYQKSPEGIDKRRVYVKDVLVFRRDKLNAYQKIRRAKEKGLLLESPCEVCSSDRIVHAHHKDYSNPYDIVWLCPQCHADEHRRI